MESIVTSTKYFYLFFFPKYLIWTFITGKPINNSNVNNFLFMSIKILTFEIALMRV
jgi:hypothetical protein